MLIFVSESRRRHSYRRTKYRHEIIRIVKSQFPGDFLDLLIRIGQQIFGSGYTHLLYVLTRCDARVLFEQFAELGITDAQPLRQGLWRYGIQVFGYFDPDFLDKIIRAVRIKRTVSVIVEGQAEDMEGYGGQQGLIAGFLGIGYFVGTPEERDQFFAHARG